MKVIASKRQTFELKREANEELPQTAVPLLSSWGWLQKVVNPHWLSVKIPNFRAEKN